MSSVYNLEPPTKGKVVLKTTIGDLDIELWGKEAPKAVRNFVQLCMEGYYDNTIFHRVMKGYLVQAGDPTGTGQGGESIYGEMFKDEFHSRLKFSHRGLLACANQNEPNTNASQFFVTLDKTDWLDKKNTIFGRISGDSIYNLLRIEELEVDDDDRPLDPPRILEAEILWNPFEDIVPRRNAKAEREAAEAKRIADAAAKKKASRPTSKNLGLLSFGEEAEEEEEQLAAAAAAAKAAWGIKIRSAHDVLGDERLARPEDTPDDEIIVISERALRKPKNQEEKDKAAKADAEALKHTKATLGGRGHSKGGEESNEDDRDGEGDPSGSTARQWGSTKDGGGDFAAAMHAQAMKRREAMGDERAEGEGGRREQSGRDAGGRGRVQDRQEEEEEEESEDDETALEKRNRKYANKGPYSGRVRATDEVEDADLLKPYQVMREKYKLHKRLLGDREKDTMARLAKFTANLKGGSKSKSGEMKEGGQDDKEDVGAAGYNGKVRKDIDHNSYLPAAWRVDDYLERDDLDATLDDLREHKLKFSDPSGRTDEMTRVDNLDDYVVFDPLLEKGKGKFSKAENDKKKRKTEWAGKPNV